MQVGLLAHTTEESHARLVSRPLRIQVPGGFYHVMNRGVSRGTVFSDDTDRSYFLRVLSDASKLWEVRFHAYCLLGNHYHLLLETPLANISRAMRHIGGVYAQRFNQRHDRDGPLFRGRYKAILVERNAYLIDCVCYIHRNSLEAGIVEHPSHDPWSSHAAYLSTAECPRWLTTRTVLEMFASDVDVAKYRLDAFVTRGTPRRIKRKLDAERWPPVLGTEPFRRRFSAFSKDPGTEDVPKIADLERLPSMETVMTAVGVHYGIGPKHLRIQGRRGGGEAREVFVYLARRLAKCPFAKIARVLGIRLGSASRVFERAERRWRADPGFRQALTEVASRVA